MQEVAETMEKQNLKEESIEFYNQVIHISPHQQGASSMITGSHSLLQAFLHGNEAIPWLQINPQVCTCRQLTFLLGRSRPQKPTNAG